MLTKETHITHSENIVILGCGLSGMITALSFAKLKIPITIIESKSTSDKDFFSDIRTTAITGSSRKFLDEIGVWKSIQEVVGDILDIYVVDNKAPQMIHFSSEDQSFLPLGYIVRNTDFKRILFNELQKNKLITLIDQCSYKKVESTDNNSIIQLDNNKTINCNLLIVCDGSRSIVRTQYFPNYIEKYYGQTAITFYVKHEKEHEGTAVEHFMISGPFAILPLKNPYTSSIVWSLKDEQAKIFQELPKEEFEYLVQRNFGEFLGKIKIDSAIEAFPLKACLTKDYFYKRIILVADSAHIIHPLAGQGLNQGMKDICTLTEIIHDIGINSLAFQKYQSFRQKDNMNMYLITDNINRIFSNSSKVLMSIRRTGMKIIEQFPIVKRRLAKYAGGER